MGFTAVAPVSCLSIACAALPKGTFGISSPIFAIFPAPPNISPPGVALASASPALCRKLPELTPSPGVPVNPFSKSPIRIG